MIMSTAEKLQSEQAKRASGAASQGIDVCAEFLLLNLLG